jgi:hypothetical protein
VKNRELTIIIARFKNILRKSVLLNNSQLQVGDFRPVI